MMCAEKDVYTDGRLKFFASSSFSSSLLSIVRPPPPLVGAVANSDSPRVCRFLSPTSPSPSVRFSFPPAPRALLFPPQPQLCLPHPCLNRPRFYCRPCPRPDASASPITLSVSISCWFRAISRLLSIFAHLSNHDSTNLKLIGQLKKSAH